MFLSYANFGYEINIHEKKYFYKWYQKSMLRTCLLIVRGVNILL